MLARTEARAGEGGSDTVLRRPAVAAAAGASTIASAGGGC